MTNLLTVLELRGLLKSYKKNDTTIAVQVSGCDPVFCKIGRLGWFTVTFEIYDSDEETWLATETIAIGDIVSINERSIERTRLRLIYDNISEEEAANVRAGYIRDDEEDEGLED